MIFRSNSAVYMPCFALCVSGPNQQWALDEPLASQYMRKQEFGIENQGYENKGRHPDQPPVVYMTPGNKYESRKERHRHDSHPDPGYSIPCPTRLPALSRRHVEITADNLQHDR